MTSRYSYQVGGGEILKLREGQEIEGRFVQIREGKQFAGNAEPSMLAVLDLEDGRRVAIPANIVLTGKLAQIRPGAGVCIKHLGMRPGKTYNDYTVYTESPNDIVSVPRKVAPTAAAPQNDRERPASDRSEPW